MLIARYLPLFKLRICSLITFSAIVGLAATRTRGADIDFLRLAALAAATMLAAAGASAFNHYFDRDIDAIMQRTAARPLPAGGVIGGKTVLVLSIALFLMSILVSLKALNYMVALHLALGALVYAVLYTAWLKRRSWINIIVGGLAGSFAVLAGGASAGPGFCLPPVLLAMVIFFWTPSHFWSFAIYHRREYAKAGVPMLPVVIGDKKTAFYMLINTVALTAASLAPFIMGHGGYIYLAAALGCGAYFIAWNVRLVLNPAREIAWKNFKISMAYLAVLFTAVIIEAVIKGMRG
ncbi:MAG: protoheme IX farnesyltransferase [Deltaproteobacteria bacterium]|nr:protoheme IX farnesyltransferase [Deltaproteobacteria bacterium]